MLEFETHSGWKSLLRNIQEWEMSTGIYKVLTSILKFKPSKNIFKIEHLWPSWGEPFSFYIYIQLKCSSFLLITVSIPSSLYYNNFYLSPLQESQFCFKSKYLFYIFTTINYLLNFWIIEKVFCYIRISFSTTNKYRRRNNFIQQSNFSHFSIIGKTPQTFYYWIKLES